MGLNICFGSTPKGLKMDLEIIHKVEKSLIGSIKSAYWM